MLFASAHFPPDLGESGQFTATPRPLGPFHGKFSLTQFLSGPIRACETNLHKIRGRTDVAAAKTRLPQSLYGQHTITNANFVADVHSHRRVCACAAHSHVGIGCSGNAVVKTRSPQLP